MPNGGVPSAGELAGDKARKVAHDLAILDQRFHDLLARMVIKGLLTSAERDMMTSQMPKQQTPSWNWDYMDPNHADIVAALQSIPLPGGRPVVQSIPGLPNNDELITKLRALADMWEDQANRDPYVHGDPWCRSRRDCVEQLREVLGDG